jgi:hypothetical protein
MSCDAPRGAAWTRHRIEVIGAFVLGIILALAYVYPASSRPAGFCIRKPNHPQCPAPTVQVTPRVTLTPTAPPTTAPTVTPTPTAPPTPAPTVPGPQRPFPAPVTTATYTVPASIDATGATDVHVSLNAWIEGVPDGSVIVFPDGIFRLSQGVMLGSRQNLVFRLGNAEFRLTGAGSSHFSSAFIPGYRRNVGWTGGAAHLTFEGGIVRGNDTCPGCPQPLRGENQQAVRCNGSRYIEVTGMTVIAVSGDGAFFDNCDDVWVHHNEIVTAGRNGLTVIKGQRVLGEDNLYGDVGYAVFDLEPNVSSEASADITWRRNTVTGPWQSGIGLVSVDGAGTGASIARVTIADITSSVAPQVYIDNKAATTRMRDVTVINVRGPAGGTIRIIDVDGVLVYGNSAPLTLTGCTNVRSQ